MSIPILQMPAPRPGRMTFNPQLGVPVALVFVALGTCLFGLSPHSAVEYADFLGCNLLLVALVGLLSTRDRAPARPVMEPMLDPDTRVLNASALYRECDLELARARRLKTPTTLIDIQVLRATQRTRKEYVQAVEDAIDCLRGQLRNTDIIGRYGVDEFMVALSNAGEAARNTVVERLRDSLLTYFAPQDLVLSAQTFLAAPATAHLAIKSTRLPRELMNMKTSA